MNMKQVWGAAGGFFLAYLLITLTNKPHVDPHDVAGSAPAPAADATHAPAAALEAATAGGRQWGFCYPGVGAGALAESRSDDALAALAATGAGWVALTPILFQASGTASDVRVDASRTPTMDALGHAIDRAHALGLKVMLRPVVTADDGTRREAFVPLDAAGWFASYGHALLPYLDLASQRQVEAFCLGSSYSGLESQPWPQLISQARERYRGALTYGASLAGAYQRVPFWAELDYVGLDAVYGTGGSAAAPPAWRDALAEVEAWLASQPSPKPVLFTSLGIGRDVPAAGASDDDPQRQAFAGFFEAALARPWIAGAYGYYWANPAAGPDDTGFPLAERPALEVLKSAYAGTAAPGVEVAPRGAAGRPAADPSAD